LDIIFWKKVGNNFQPQLTTTPIDDIHDHLSEWKANTPNIFNIVAIIQLAAGLSSFAECTFSKADI
jgi:hypothetical protein